MDTVENKGEKLGADEESTYVETSFVTFPFWPRPHRLQASLSPMWNSLLGLLISLEAPINEKDLVLIGEVNKAFYVCNMCREYVSFYVFKLQLFNLKIIQMLAPLAHREKKRHTMGTCAPSAFYNEGGQMKSRMLRQMNPTHAHCIM